MLILGPIGFATPWVLSALLALPVLWIVLRAMPPAPRRQIFPAAALLRDLADKAMIAHRTPWWLLLIRLGAVAMLILAFSGPVWKPVIQPQSSGPLLVVLDAGWAAAKDWPGRLRRAEQALDHAAGAGRPVALLITDGRKAQDQLQFAEAGRLMAQLRAAQPVSWPSTLPDDPDATLGNVPDGPLSTLWITDGLEHPNREIWLAALTKRGDVSVVPPTGRIHALTQSETATGAAPGLTMISDQTSATGNAPQVLAIGPDPQGVERELARLTPGPATTNDAISVRPVVIDLQPELRNRITRFVVEGEAHAGAVVLADDQLRRRKVALVGDADGQVEGQQLLSPLHYLRGALAMSTDLIEGGIADVLSAAPDVIVLVDQVDLPETGALTDWVKDGGLLVRFSGPRMAGFEGLLSEPLLPVALRQGGRDIGGALSWGDPRGFAPFQRDGIFGGLTAPDDVTVRAQLMAQPSPTLSGKIVAALTDSTPVVTRDRLGQGQIVLFHVTANAEWSNLPLSGLFVQMLNRIVETARSNPVEEQTDDRERPFWSAETVLDGFGRPLSAADLPPVAADELQNGPAADRPAGIYRAGERRLALNAGYAFTPATWPGASVEIVGQSTGRQIRGLLLAIAALLLGFDVIGSAFLARAGRFAAMLVLVICGSWQPADAQETVLDPDLIRAADEVALAYVKTGDAETDTVARQGLRGLSWALRQRTTVEPGEPVAIDLDNDDLSVLTFLYWPVTDSQPLPSPRAYLRLNHYLRSGGMILFDTMDGDIAGVGGPDMSQSLRNLASPLELPPLAPVPEDHVLTRSFYLLDAYPGRWQGQDVWVEAPLARGDAGSDTAFRKLNDGVSPVIVGGNSWMEAWAVDDNGYPVFPVGRGFEGERQREMAFRFGINLIMYVLTGNYKSDQVHVPALLDRLRDEGASAP